MRKIISFFLIAVFLIIPVSAASSSSPDVEYVQKAGFWTWAAGQNEFLHGLIGSTGASCPNSEDGYHHASSYQRPEASWGGLTGYYKCICDLCGAEFKAYESDLQQSYEAQVEELPAPSYNSSGKLLLPLSHDYIKITCDEGSVANAYVYRHCEHYTGSLGLSYSIHPSGSLESDKHYLFCLDCNVSSISLVPLSGKSSFSYRSGRSVECTFFYSATAPIDGYFTISPGQACSVNFLNSDGRYNSIVSIGEVEVSPTFFLSYGSFQSSKFFAKGDKISFSFSIRESGGGRSLSVQAFTPIVEVVPFTTLSDNFYNIQSRPTSITGNYGIIGDNGQIIKVEGDKIVNETNNTIYNPATGETHTLSDWSYNYTDRSYTVTTETGDTITVTYGDENVTIKEGDTTYNIYYLVDGGGSETPGPEVCDHDWAEDSTIRPTCSTPGKITMTCSKCSQTKTENLPALGHNWTVDRTVQTSYDEQGNLVQQGYTIYKCSVCGEQYKDSEGTGPPGTPGGSGPGSSGGDGEKSIWEKIGEFFGTIGGGFLEIIGAVAGKLLDALTKLAEMLLGKLKTVVETILTIFDEVPALFGGFLDFLGAVFPFLPPEITTILTFGVIAITFIGILKAVRR